LRLKHAAFTLRGFGNVAVRTWNKKSLDSTPSSMQKLLPCGKKKRNRILITCQLDLTTRNEKKNSVYFMEVSLSID